MKEEFDKVLDELKDAVAPVMESIEQEIDSDRAAIVIGAKEMIVDGEYTGIQTFVDISGDFGILGEALYTELMSGIDEKKPQLFKLLRTVIRAIEEELDLKDDEPFEESDSQTIH